MGFESGRGLFCLLTEKFPFEKKFSFYLFSSYYFPSLASLAQHEFFSLRIVERSSDSLIGRADFFRWYN